MKHIFSEYGTEINFNYRLFFCWGKEIFNAPSRWKCSETGFCRAVLQEGGSGTWQQVLTSTDRGGSEIYQVVQTLRVINYLEGSQELVQHFIEGLYIGARALHVLNLIWFGYIVRLS